MRRPAIFFTIETIDSVQEDWVFHNSLYDNIEFASPILKPGDFVVWVRSLHFEHNTQPNARSEA